MFFATLITQGDESPYQTEVKVLNIKIHSACMFLLMENAAQTIRLLNWILEVCEDADHLCLEISGMCDHILVIDLAFFDQWLNLAIADVSDTSLLQLTQQTVS